MMTGAFTKVEQSGSQNISHDDDDDILYILLKQTQPDFPHDLNFLPDVVLPGSVLQEIGYTHMRVAEGVNSLLQMAGLLGRLCSKTAPPAASWTQQQPCRRTENLLLPPHSLRLFCFYKPACVRCWRAVSLSEDSLSSSPLMSLIISVFICCTCFSLKSQQTFCVCQWKQNNVKRQ